MKKIDYKTAYENTLIAYEMMVKDNKRLKDENQKMREQLTFNQYRKMYGLPPIEKEHLEKLKDINCDYNYSKRYYDHLENQAIVLDIITLKNWVNKIVDYLEK